MVAHWVEEAAKSGLSHPFQEGEVDLSNLQVDKYQRPIDNRRVQTIVDEFNPAIARTLQVSQRKDSSLWVVDGQHTLEALKARGFKSWNARLHYNLTFAQEAELFVDYNESAVRVQPIHRFKAKLYAGDNSRMRISQVLMGHGLCIHGTERVINNNGQELTPLSSVNMIEKIYERGGSEGLSVVLEVAKAAWDDGRPITDVYNTRVMPGIATLLFNATQPLNFQRLVAALNTFNPDEDLARLVKGVAGANKVIAKKLYVAYISGEGMPNTENGRKAYRLRQDSPYFPFLAVNPVKLNEPLGRMGVWSPTLDATKIRNFRGLTKESYLQ